MNQRKYDKVVQWFDETPWAILEGTLATLKAIRDERLSGERPSEEEIQARIGSGPAQRSDYRAGSVAVLPLYGVITPRADLFSQMSGGTSVETFRSSFREALSDPEVSAILIEANSPGGSVDLIPELAAEIRGARGQKPIIAAANTRAASAAYWIASQADEVVVTPSGDVGAIGVMAAHDDISGMQEKLGVKTTLVTAGKYKGEGNPHEPLSEEAKSYIQARVDEMYAVFTSDVAKGRRVPVASAREGFGEGRMLSAKQALKEGMVDRIETFDETLSRVAAMRPRRRASATASSASFAITLTGDGSNVFENLKVAQGERCAFESEMFSGPIASHSTATSDASWDGPANKARLRNDGNESYYRSAFAWQDDEADPNTKTAYKFIHHEVSGGGDVGAANVTACTTGIAVLNGGRTGTTIPSADRRGVWSHLARHLRDAGREPPPLQSMMSDEEAAESGLSFAEEASALHDSAFALVERLDSLAEFERGRLTATKRESLSACPEALREAAKRIEDALKATAPEKKLDPEALGIDAEMDWTLTQLRL